MNWTVVVNPWLTLPDVGGMREDVVQLLPLLGMPSQPRHPSFPEHLKHRSVRCPYLDVEVRAEKKTKKGNVPRAKQEVSTVQRFNPEAV